MKKIIYFRAIFLMMVFAHILEAQNPAWSVPPNRIINVNSLPLPAPGGCPTNYWSECNYNGATTNYPSNVYPDTSGNPLVFVVNGVVYNRRGYLIDRIVSALTFTGLDKANGWAQVCIVPDPASCTKYYIFTSAHDGTDCTTEELSLITYNHTPVVMQIDIAQANPYTSGEFGKNVTTGLTSPNTAHDLYTLTNTPPLVAGYCGPFRGDIHYAVTPLISGTHRLLFVNDGNVMTIYKITSTGIALQYQYSIWSLTSSGGSDYFNQNVSEMEVFVNTTRNRVKVAYTAPEAVSGGDMGLCFADFNLTTGAFITGTGVRVCYNEGGNCCNPSGPQIVSTVSGLEFSPDGSHLWFTHTPNDCHNHVLDAVDTVGTTFTHFSPTNASHFQKSQIEYHKDGNLYLIGFDTTGSGTNRRLAKVSNPNTPPTSVFTDNVVTLSNYPLDPVANGGIYELEHLVWFLPDQIDLETHGYQLYASTACCLINSVYDKFTYKTGQEGWTSTNQAWSPTSNPLNGGTGGTAIIGEELRIAAGYSVTIRNMTIKFSPQATLVVEATNGTLNSGQLTLKKCTLDVDTRCAQKMWPGVRVWGNTAYTRSSTSQGYLIIDSLTVITNARLGVELGYETFDAAYDASVVPAPTNTATAGGGLLLCTNSSFINNERDIYFGAYPNSGGISSINTSTFVTSATLIESGVSPRYFIGLKEYAPNALINGCHLSCSSNLTYALLDTGIYSLNSNYTVNKHINTGKRTSIHNLNYGVHSSNTSGTRTVTIKNSNLINNIIGIYLGKINNAYVTETDTFKLHNKMFTRGTSIGLYLDNCTGYWVQDNHFDRNALGSKNLYGVLVYNSGPYANAIFRNTFANLYKGSQAQYINYTASGQIANGTGLLYLCNKFTSISGGDIYVPARTEGANIGASYTCSPCYKSGIGYAQGAGNSASGGNRPTADNEFSQTGKDFWLGTTSTDTALNSSYIYWCPNVTLSTCSDGTYTSVWKPDPARSNNYLPSPYYLSSQPDCNTGGNGHRQLEPLEQALADAEFYKAMHDSLQELYTVSPNDFSLNLQMAAAFTDWHLALDRAIRLLLENHADSSNIVAYELMKQKADALPARVRVETGINTGDSAYAAQALAEVIAQEGQSNYVKIQSLLLKNISKLPHEYMQNPLVLSEVSAIASDSSDIPSYVTANMLLHAVGAGHYEPYVQETDTDNGAAERSNTAISTLDNKLSSRPNPFNESTIITATVAERTDNAFILITDVLGKEVARYPVHQGENAVSFNGSQTDQQILFCTLMVDGVKVKTNKIVLIK